MNDDYMIALEELECIAAVKMVTTTLVWDNYFKSTTVASDNDLTELVAKIFNSFGTKDFTKARVQALMGLLYLTKRISDMCVRLREESNANSLEVDLGIALKLPGEAANGLAFKWAGGVCQSNNMEVLNDVLSDFNSIVSGHPNSIVGGREQQIDLPLISLSLIYTMLLNMILN